MTVTGTVTREVSVRMTSPSTVSPSGLIFDSVTPGSGSVVLSAEDFSAGGFGVAFLPDWACRVRGSNQETSSNNRASFLGNTDLKDRCPDLD